MNTSEDRVKFRNIKRDKRVALLMDDAYSYVLVEGHARIARERDALKDILDLAIRYTGKTQGRKQYDNWYSKQKRVSIEISPEKVIEQL